MIDDPSISRRHAAIIHHKDGRIYIIDLASREGVKVDNNSILPNKPTQVGDGSIITLGKKTIFTLGSDSTLEASNKHSTKGPTTVRASHLLVKHKDSRRPSSWKEPVVTRSQEEALDMINRFREILVSGKEDFASLASKESHCSSARNGGDLGEFGRGQMQKVFEEATYALEVGELSGPVFSDSGVHLILRTG